MISSHAAIPQQTQTLEGLLTPNDRRILEVLFRRGALTQSALAADIGITQQSISRRVSKMIQDGLLQSGDKAMRGKRGHPTSMLALAPDYTLSCGLTLEAECVSFAVIDFTGRVRLSHMQPFSVVTPKTVLPWTAAALRQVRQSGLAKTLTGIGVGIGVGFPAQCALEAWTDLDVGRLFALHLGVPSWADKSGPLAALGESMVGVGRWARSFAYIDIGAAVGGGLVLNGEVWCGRRGKAGAFAQGLPSNLYPSPDLELLRLCIAKAGHPAATVEDLVETWDDAWPGIDDWIARVRGSFSLIASQAAAMLDLDAVVLGGKIPKPLAARLIPHLELYHQDQRATRSHTKIVPAEAPGPAVAIGAAVLPLKHRFFAPLNG